MDSPFPSAWEFLNVYIELPLLCTSIRPGLGEGQRKAELGHISNYLLLNACCVPGITFVLFHLVFIQFGFPNEPWR